MGSDVAPAPTGSILRRRGGAVKAAVLATIAAILVPTVLSAADRMASRSPALAAATPTAFAAQAVLAQGRMQLSAQQFSAAARTAQAAIKVAPIDPESTALLGAARFGLGDADGAQKAFLVAGQFGWRTPATQFYWMTQALAVSDYPVAALRLDALLRQEPGLARSTDILAPFELVRPGQEALADRLSASPVWLDVYAGSSFDLSAGNAAARAAVFTALARRGKRLGCAGISQLVGRLIALDVPALAHRIWLDHCPVGRDGLLADTSFNSLQMHQATTPFEWVIIGDSDVSLSLEQGASGRNQLMLASSAAFPRKVIMQLVPLQPGRYRLAWRAFDSAGRPTPRIGASLSCQPDARDSLAPVLDPVSKEWTATVEIDQSCGARWLSFAIQPGNDALTLGAISLIPVR